MSMPVFNLEVLTDSVLFLSSIIAFFLAFLMGWKTWRNHMKHHVFRPMLAGFSLFLFENAFINIYMLAHWKDHTPHGYEAHMSVAVMILVGYIILLSTVLYSAKHIFEKMDTALTIDETELFNKKEEKDELE